MDTAGDRLMFYKDVNELDRAKFLPTVCIIGSGPAGVSLALELEKNKIPCLIVEAGGFDYSEESQESYRGKVVGDSYFDLDAARLRYFGGSSGHWAGWCRPLDEIDFEKRSGFENSGWPIKKQNLDPYSSSTNEILELKQIASDVSLNIDLNEIEFEFSPPVNFGTKYRDHIKNSKLIGLLINSPVSDLVSINNKIVGINLISKNGVKQQIKAEYFSLCSGGIENSRILLWSNQLHKGSVVPMLKP